MKSLTPSVKALIVVGGLAAVVVTTMIIATVVEVYRMSESNKTIIIPPGEIKFPDRN